MSTEGIVSTWELPRRGLETIPSARPYCINLRFGHLRGLFEKPVGASSDCINLGFGHLRGPYQSSTVAQKHCINLGSGRLRRSFLTPEGEALDCINLGSGQLRGLSIDAQPVIAHCINLRFGQLRGLQGQDHVGVVDCINLGAAKTRTSPTPTVQANDTAFPSSIKSTICKQVFYPVHFRSSKGYNFFIRNTLRERSPHVRRQVGGTPEHPRR